MKTLSGLIMMVVVLISFSVGAQPQQPTLQMRNDQRIALCMSACIDEMPGQHGDEVSTDTIMLCVTHPHTDRARNVCGPTLAPAARVITESICRHGWVRGCENYGVPQPRSQQQTPRQSTQTRPTPTPGVQVSPPHVAVVRVVPAVCRALTGQSLEDCRRCVSHTGYVFESTLSYDEVRYMDQGREMIFPSETFHDVCFTSADRAIQARLNRHEQRITAVENNVQSLNEQVTALRDHVGNGNGGTTTVSDAHIRELAHNVIDSRLGSRDESVRLISFSNATQEIQSANQRAGQAMSTAIRALDYSRRRMNSSQTWNFTSFSLYAGGLLTGSSVGSGPAVGQPMGGPFIGVQLLHRVGPVGAFRWGGGLGISLPGDPEVRALALGEAGVEFYGPSWVSFGLGAGVSARLGNRGHIDIGPMLDINLGPSIYEGNGFVFTIRGMGGFALQYDQAGASHLGGFGGAMVLLGYRFGGRSTPENDRVATEQRQYWDQPVQLPGRSSQPTPPSTQSTYTHSSPRPAPPPPVPQNLVPREEATEP